MNPLQTSPELKFRTLDQCPVCASKSRRSLYPIHETVLHRCSSCGFKYWDPCITDACMAHIYQSSEHLSQRCAVHETYYEYGDLNKPSKTLSDYQKGIALLEKYRLANLSKTLFEIGFGSGLFLAAAREQGWQVDGVDTSPENVSLAKKKFDLALRQGNFADNSIAPESFSAAAAWDVLEHQADPNEFLKKINGLLKPDGLFLVAVPNDFSFLTLLSDFLYRLSGGRLSQGIRKFYVLEHIGYYNHQTLKKVLEQNGFQEMAHFFTSTDLRRYRFQFWERLAASLVLLAGKMLRLQNRIVVVGRKVR